MVAATAEMVQPQQPLMDSKFGKQGLWLAGNGTAKGDVVVDADNKENGTSNEDVKQYLRKILTDANGEAEVATNGTAAPGSPLVLANGPPPSSPKLTRCLSKLHTWAEFDVFELAELSNGRPLYTITMQLLKEHDLLDGWKLDRQKTEAFLNAVEVTYNSSNAYHNSTHAADVVQASNLFLQASSQTVTFTKLEKFSLIIGAAVHDLAHPGYTNDFLVNSRHEFAILYNDKSVNENWHICSAFKIAQTEETNIFSGLTRAEYQTVRKYVINSILATDMANHFNLMERLEAAKESESDVNKWTDHEVLVHLLLHAADLCNPARPTRLAVRWAELICEEFLEQGDKEGEMGMDVTPMCNRQSVILGTNQLRFIQWFLKPTLEATRFLTGDAFYFDILHHLAVTEAQWQEQQRLAQEGRANPHKGCI